MKVGLPTFMLTADEPATVQKYGHENSAAVFIGTADEPTPSQTYVRKMPRGIFIRKNPIGKICVTIRWRISSPLERDKKCDY